ncbi:transcriptional regulator with XRE-family HTH domain [Pedobacter cryoconitis]|uniref:helix-turn-helix domain-containing protein n=1 Tax=Pedobacter cryoconitis TaxID=188932 RepID=UPI001614427D|nr:hypothetical protein [Pedobacter cryoconitis]MBB6271193.1 transcriptional regulator with XRE-family HTH domain [Pedobacter cryoconitis]
MKKNERINSITAWTKRDRQHIDIIYTIQQKRIEKGYSQVEISFLLGLSRTRIRLIEQFAHPDIDYTIIDLMHLALLYKCEIKDFFREIRGGSEELQVGVYKGRDDYGATVFEAYYLVNNSYELLYKISEETTRIPKPQSAKLAIKACIHSLLKSKFFKRAVSPLEIYEYCRINLECDFSPKHIAQVLHDSFLKGTAKPLRRVKKDGRYSYFLHSVPLIKPEKS